ncbi:type VI secretion system baseplate subunit TssF [Rubrivivax gelatinosus]|uniref:Type VI secretion system ImpG/VasA family protein n=1 Tax=Rubrivivax gelatinosus TaxID=28068 RepID=A0ABS1E3E8_RUBGE|nr:type VI secretion system baseplate subunit TssF [Rubrivivax gelatinosus]MBK1715412.1 type VI secretion system ImpG/VasA family protein [Rubrivivax gelatinosus]
MQTLLPHYERELAWFEEAAQTFARRYPRIAGRLSTSGDLLEDPHVERLIQSFALLAARLHQRLDDEFPLVSEALLELLNPLVLQPFPSCSIARFVADRGLSQISSARRIPRGTLLHSAPVRGVPCRFTTGYDLALAPLRIVHAGLHRPGEASLPGAAPAGTAAWFRVELELVSAAARWDTLGLPALRVFIDAQPSQAAALRSAWLDHTAGMLLDTGSGQPLALSDTHRPRPVGLGAEHALVDGDDRSGAADRLLTEYFAFPEKFDFVDLPLPRAPGGAQRRVTLLYALRAPRPGEAAPWAALEGLNERQLVLGCTPVVNLFRQRAEPIRVTQASEAYAVVVDARRPAAYEVLAVERVRRRRLCDDGEQAAELPPLYSLRHASLTGPQASACWSVRRDPQRAELDPGHELELVLVDQGLDPSLAASETLSIDVCASNRDLPELLSIGQPGGDLHADGGTLADEIVLLRRPSASRRLQRGTDSLWRLVSHLALARQTSGAASLDGVKELLALHARGADASVQRIVDGLLAMDQRPASSWLPGPPTPSLVHGTDIRITVAEAAFVGTGVGLFGRLLSECFARRTPVNTFTRLLLTVADGRTLFDGGCRTGREVQA